MTETDRENASSTGSARKTELQLDGACLSRTVRLLRMKEDVLRAVQDQAATVLTEVVKAYEESIAVGEVGANGTAIANRKSTPTRCPTGLLYGRIQSGKTLAMIMFSALALDNGFRVIIVLTSNFVELVTQTKRRFASLGRALVHASTEREAWSDDVANIRKHVGDRGLVLICAKDGRHLESVLELLQGIGASGLPALILDDEADQASLDNNVRKRSQATDPSSIEPTRIHTLIADIRKELRHHVFLQVTASPFALFLQNVTSESRPQFTCLLEPGTDYTGGDDFFELKHLGDESETGDPSPPLIYVDEGESVQIESGPREAPTGLERAITFFLVAAAAQALANDDVYDVSQNFLCHTSHKKTEHDKLYDLIASFLMKFEDQLASKTGHALSLLQWAIAELSKTYGDVPSIDAIIDDIIDRLPRRAIRVVNSDGKSNDEVAGVPNFIIGGNIVGRGLTIDNLLVTYYLRKPKISQMDTMLQHARMFGYRRSLMKYTRVFLPRSLAVRFHGIHVAEQNLRDVVADGKKISAVPVQVIGDGLRTTRYGVLDTGSVVSLPSGAHRFPSRPDVQLAGIEKPKKRNKRITGVVRILEDSFGRTFEELNAAATMEPKRLGSPKALLELLGLFQPLDWNTTGLDAILKTVAFDGGFLKFRRMKRNGSRDGYLLTGAVSGEELDEARRQPYPTFFVFYQRDKMRTSDLEDFFYPTLVFPRAMATLIYNETGDES